MLLVRRPQTDPALRERLDPGYWHPAYEEIVARCRLPLEPLGRYVADITYGPIVTGMEPPECAEGIPIVHQGQVGLTGVDLREAVRVAEGSPWDKPRARLRPGDIAMPRSGDASVAKNRVALFCEDTPAVVGSFVNLIRLRDIEPAYVLVCLKTQIVFSQVHRLINGVGTPNISFDETRSLLVPMLPAEQRAEVSRRYFGNVHSAHLRYLAGDRTALTQGTAALRALVEELDRLCAGDLDGS